MLSRRVGRKDGRRECPKTKIWIPHPPQHPWTMVSSWGTSPILLPLDPWASLTACPSWKPLLSLGKPGWRKQMPKHSLWLTSCLVLGHVRTHSLYLTSFQSWIKLVLYYSPVSRIFINLFLFIQSKFSCSFIMIRRWWLSCTLTGLV
jgi:hypothetical protein